MGDQHGHDHSTGNIKLAFVLNSLFAVIELFGGLYTNSMAILSDALHDFGDSISLGLAWYLQKKSKQKQDAVFTYGYGRFSILAAFINSIILAIGSVIIIKKAIERLAHPEHADAKGMVLLAVLGIAFNTIAMLRLKRGSSINERVISLHFIEDILGWIAVLIGSLVMMFYNVPMLDPILSLGIAGFILFNVYRNLKPALRIVLQGVPHATQQEEISALILKDARVGSIHDFRLWSLDGEHNVVSLHVVTLQDMKLSEVEELKARIKEELKTLNVIHATIEIEYEPRHCVIESPEKEA